jgi:hypothetical protein
LEMVPELVEDVRIMLKENTCQNYDEIEISPQISVDQFEDIAVAFFPAILDMEYKDVLITDESSLYDFDSEIDPDSKRVIHRTQERLDRIKKVYKIDVSDIEDLFLIKIFERIRILSL